VRHEYSTFDVLFPSAGFTPSATSRLPFTISNLCNKHSQPRQPRLLLSHPFVLPLCRTVQYKESNHFS